MEKLNYNETIYPPHFAKIISKALLVSGLISTSLVDAQNWSLSGNTPNPTAFLGTTNASDLIFKTNHQQRMVLKSNGYLGVGTNEPEAWQEILYCPPPGIAESGLIVTKEDCHNNVAVFDPSLPDNIGFGIGTSNIEEFPLPFVFSTGHVTNAITPTYNPEAPLFWVRTQIPANSMNNPGPSDEYDTKMIVMPDGSCGINIAQPRAALDVRGSQAQNHPAAIFGSRALGTGGPSGPNGLFQYYTQMIQMVPNLSNSGYNNISSNGDQGIIYSDGKGLNGSNLSSALVIAPWVSQNNDSVGIRLDHEGNVSIGFRQNFGFKMAVNGNVGINGDILSNGMVKMNKARVEVANWPDYVFESDYQLLSLDSLNMYITQNGHLPGIPSYEDVMEEGIDLGEMNALLLKKVEELTLYIIQLHNNGK